MNPESHAPISYEDLKSVVLAFTPLSKPYPAAVRQLLHPEEVAREDARAKARARLESVPETTEPAHVAAHHISDVLTDFEARLKAGPLPTLSTPFPTLNHFLDGGMSPGELMFLGARPGVGKTALGLELARWAARKGSGGAVIVVSREMTTQALIRRMVAQEGRISASALKRSTLNATDEWSLQESIVRLRTLPIWLTADAVSLSQIRSLVIEMSEEAPITLLIVDYLQLVRASSDIRERRHQIEAVSQGLKTIALQYQIPVLCLSSLSRAVGDDKNKPPTLGSLRESGELEHDADIILLLHRAHQAVETSCIVAKNRDGRTGDLTLLFRGDYVSFDELAEG